MTEAEKDLELIALRALLKEAHTYGMHADACACFANMEVDEIAADENCNCWMFYAGKVTDEARQEEAARVQQPVISQTTKEFVN